LNVTPAAMSHQIKGLEEFLAAKLFRRAKRTLMLTPAGQTLLPRKVKGTLPFCWRRRRAARSGAGHGDDRRPITIQKGSADMPLKG
jgi:hypothetical protein